MDPACGKLHDGKKVTTRFYVTDGAGGLGDCVVYLEGAKGGAATKEVVIDQKGCEYLPYISSAQVNQPIRVLNSDPVLHNVHPTPTVDGNKEQNKAQLPKGAPLDFTFAKAEKFLRFKCDVHPWMFSYVSIFDHGFHAVSAKDGSYKITGVPDGKYKLVVEHRKGGKVEKEIEVKGGAKADFTIEAK
jgi:plastocyanin